MPDQRAPGDGAARPVPAARRPVGVPDARSGERPSRRRPRRSRASTRTTRRRSPGWWRGADIDDTTRPRPHHARAGSATERAERERAEAPRSSRSPGPSPPTTRSPTSSARWSRATDRSRARPGRGRAGRARRSGRSTRPAQRAGHGHERPNWQRRIQNWSQALKPRDGAARRRCRDQRTYDGAPALLSTLSTLAHSLLDIRSGGIQWPNLKAVETPVSSRSSRDPSHGHDRGLHRLARAVRRRRHGDTHHSLDINVNSM